MEFGFEGILPGAKFTFRSSVALSYIGSVTARHSSCGRQPNCGLNRERHTYSAGRPSRWALAHILVLFSSSMQQTKVAIRQLLVP